MDTLSSMMMSGTATVSSGGRVSSNMKICPVCKEDYRTDFETQVFRSKLCGHIVCSRCLARKGISPDRGRPEDGECLVCHTRPVSNTNGEGVVFWEDVAQEENWFEREAVVRAKVLDVLCVDRSCFQSTPLYNSFLEEREEIIYEMAFSEDPKIRQERAEFLKQYEIEHQSQTLQAFERLKRKKEDFIRDIVAKEGNFYELVKRDPKPYQFVSTAPKSSTSRVRTQHPLEKLHPELFGDGTNDSGSLGYHQGVAGGGNKKEAAGAAMAGSAKGSAFLAELYANLPPTLVPNIQWHQITKQNKDFKLAADAGGHLKEVVNRRAMQELFNGIRYDDF